MKTLALLLSVFFCSQIQAAEIPFEILGQGGPSMASNGFPFTFTVQVKSTIKLQELIKSVELKADFVDGEKILLPRSSKWTFPYTENHGLMQFLFIIPEDQLRGFYTFSGYLEVKTPEGIVQVPLKSYQMEIGGPRNH